MPEINPRYVEASSGARWLKDRASGKVVGFVDDGGRQYRLMSTEDVDGVAPSDAAYDITVAEAASMKATVSGGGIYKALQRFRTVLAGRNTAPVDILHVGDSITFGVKAATTEQRWTSVMRDALRTAFPNKTAVAGGFGFLSCAEQQNGYFSDTHVARTGGSLQTSNFGLDANGVLMNSASSVTYTAVGTGFDLFYAASPGTGTFSYQVDGGSVTNVNTAGTANNAARNQAIRGLSAGSHTVVVSWVSGTVYHTGAFVYNGDESVGIRSWNGSAPSTSTNYWWVTSNKYWIDSVTNIQPALVTIELGPNDYAGTGITTPAAFKSNLTAIIAAIKAKCSIVPSFVLLPCWPLVVSGSSVATWPEYVAAMREIAASDPTNVCILDWQSFTSDVAGTTIGGLLDFDFAHPSVTGNRYLGELTADFVKLKAA